MSNPNIYDELQKQGEKLELVDHDVQILQIAFALLAQKLYPTFKIDQTFWDEVTRQFREHHAKNETPDIQDLSLGE